MSTHSRNLSDFPINRVAEYKYLQLNDPRVRLLLVLFNTITVRQATRVAGRLQSLNTREGWHVISCIHRLKFFHAVSMVFSPKCSYIQNFQGKGIGWWLSTLAFPMAGSFQNKKYIVFRGFLPNGRDRGPHACLQRCRAPL